MALVSRTTERVP